MSFRAVVRCGLLFWGLSYGCGDGRQGPALDASADDASMSSDPDAAEARDAFVGDATRDAALDDAARDAALDDAADDASRYMVEDAASDAGADADADLEASTLCPAEQRALDGCQDLHGKSEGASGLCDGLDNDCNGHVDEGCPCDIGTVQACFNGPPGRAHVGACGMGTQTCVPAGEFAAFSACEGASLPSAETCDGLDNDCNGCSDDVQACIPVLTCPSPDDPRIPHGTPFSTLNLDASIFYSGQDIASVRWSVEGSPCDKLFLAIPGTTATSENGQLSFTLSGASQPQATLHVTLSGTYVVTMNLVLQSGETLGCTFPVQVRGPGLRTELCWDKTGPTSASAPLDLDLHLARRGSTTNFGSSQDFYYETFSPPLDPAGTGLWGHPNTPGTAGCMTGDPSLDFINDFRGNCLNPRLDADNQDRSDRYVAENINLDNPRAGEVFQIGVQHTSEFAMRTRARVNVYCAGHLRGSFELDPAITAFSDSVGAGEYWRVVQVAPLVDANGITTDCALTPLSADGSATLPRITIDDFVVDWRD